MLTVRILLINPPHPSIGSRIPDEHLPPLGLLSIGGPLIDAGHQVRLLDAEFGPMSTEEIVSQAVTFAPQAVLLGHSGSTSGHPTVVQVTRAIREALPVVGEVHGDGHAVQAPVLAAGPGASRLADPGRNEMVLSHRLASVALRDTQFPLSRPLPKRRSHARGILGHAAGGGIPRDRGGFSGRSGARSLFLVHPKEFQVSSGGNRASSLQT